MRTKAQEGAYHKGYEDALKTGIKPVGFTKEYRQGYEDARKLWPYGPGGKDTRFGVKGLW